MQDRGTAAALMAAAACVLTLAIASSAAGQTIRVRPGPAPSRIGIATRDVTHADADRDRLPGEWGAYVDGVEPDGPAGKAGMRTGDAIVEFDGVRVRSSAELQRLVRETPPGRTVKVGVFRDGKRVDLTVTTEAGNGRDFTFEIPPDGRSFTFRPEFPPSGPRLVFPGPIPLPNTPRLGIGVQDLTPQLADYFHTKEGVLVATVEDGSPASRAGVKAGDIITTVDGKPAAHADDVRSAVNGKQPGDEVTLGIVRDGKPRTIKVTLAGHLRGYF